MSLINLVEANNLAGVKEYIDSGFIDTDNRQQIYGEALIAACKNGSLGIAKLLITRGADISMKTQRGSNILMISASNGHQDLVRFLLQEEMFDINYQRPDGMNALIRPLHNSHNPFQISA